MAYARSGASRSIKNGLLGLRNLTMIEQIQKMIYYARNEKIDLNEIPLDDHKTFELLQKEIQQAYSSWSRRE